MNSVTNDFSLKRLVKASNNSKKSKQHNVPSSRKVICVYDSDEDEFFEDNFEDDLYEGDDFIDQDISLAQEDDEDYEEDESDEDESDEDESDDDNEDREEYSAEYSEENNEENNEADVDEEDGDEEDSDDQGSQSMSCVETETRRSTRLRKKPISYSPIDKRGRRPKHFHHFSKKFFVRITTFERPKCCGIVKNRGKRAITDSDQCDVKSRWQHKITKKTYCKRHHPDFYESI